MHPDRKPCHNCGQSKLLSDFALQAKGKYGRNSRCKTCVTAKYHERRAADPEAAKVIDRHRVAKWRAENPQRNRESNRRRKVEVRRRVADYKSERGCEKCGVTDPRVLDLHHRDGDDKILAVSQMVYRFGWKAVLAEAEKCRVLCANCHRIEHAEVRGDVQMTTGVFFRAS